MEDEIICQAAAIVCSGHLHVGDGGYRAYVGTRLHLEWSEMRVNEWGSAAPSLNHISPSNRLRSLAQRGHRLQAI